MTDAHLKASQVRPSWEKPYRGRQGSRGAQRTHQARICTRTVAGWHRSAQSHRPRSAEQSAWAAGRRRSRSSHHPRTSAREVRRRAHGRQDQP